MDKGFSTSCLAALLAFVTGLSTGYIFIPDAPHATSERHRVAWETLRNERNALEKRLRYLEEDLKNADMVAAPTARETVTRRASHRPALRVESAAQPPVSLSDPESGLEHLGNNSELERLKAIEAKHYMRVAEQHLSNIQQKHAADAATAIEKEFNLEPADGAWSYAQEDSIQDVFTGSPSLAEAPLVDADCRTTQCRISMLSGSEPESFSQITEIYQEIDKLGEWDGYYTVVDPASGLTNIYLQRKK